MTERKRHSKRLLSSLLTALTITQFASGTLISSDPTSVHATMQRFETNTNRMKCPPEEKEESKFTTPENGTHGEIPHIETVHKVYEFLHEEYGFSGKVIAGILGNFWQESGLKPWIVEGHYTASKEESAKLGIGVHEQPIGTGLAQWTYGRNKMLMDFVEKETGDRKNWIDPDIQMKFMAEGDNPADIGVLQRIGYDDEDVIESMLAFHDDWERSADTERYGKEWVIERRGGYAKKIWEYMKENDMDGKKDEKKLAKLDEFKQGDGTGGPTVSTATNKTNDDVDLCADDGLGMVKGEIGASVPPNGGRLYVEQGLNEKQIMSSDHAKYIDIKFPQGYDHSKSPFQGNIAGQCTELTWAFIGELYNETPTAMGNGGFVVDNYVSMHGVEKTDHPTVGFAFSMLNGTAGTSPTYGHTGVVVGVRPDGGFYTVDFNWPPYSAPSRVPVYQVHDGNKKGGSKAGGMDFAPGPGGAKDKYKGKGNKKKGSDDNKDDE